MKKLFLMLSLTAIVMSASAQTFPKECVTEKKVEGLNLRMSQAGDVVKSATYSTVTVPVSFAQLVHNADNSWSVGQSFNVGLSYVLGKANAIIHADGSTTLSESFYYGVATTYGVAQSSGSTVSSYTAGVVGGFDQFSLMFARDFLNANFVVGVSYNLSGLPFLNAATKIDVAQ